MDASDEVRRTELAEERSRILLRELQAKEEELERLRAAQELPTMPSLPAKQKAVLTWIGAKIQEQALAILLSLVFGVAAALRPAATPQKVENQGISLNAAQTDLNNARDRIQKLEACRKLVVDWAAAQQAYDLEVWAQAGVKIRRRDDAPPTRPTLEFEAPALKPGKITALPVLHVLTPPPAPPNCQ